MMIFGSRLWSGSDYSSGILIERHAWLRQCYLFVILKSSRPTPGPEVQGKERKSNRLSASSDTRVVKLAVN
jgi:hypothetical protein